MRTNMPAAMEMERRIRKFMDDFIVPFITRHDTATPLATASWHCWAAGPTWVNACAGPTARFRPQKQNASVLRRES